MSKRAALYSRSTPYFTALSRIESCPALKQYLFAVTIAKSGANACTKCPAVTILHHSFPTSSYSSRTWLWNCASDISKWMVSSISVSSALPKGPFFSSRFIPLLASSQFVAVYARSARSNMSPHSLLPAIGEAGFRRSDKSTTRERRRRQLRELSRGRGTWYLFLSFPVLQSAMRQNIVYYV